MSSITSSRFGLGLATRLTLLLLLSAAAEFVAAAGQDAPLRPRLERIDPSPLPAGSEAVRVSLHGRGFMVGSRVAVSRNDKVELIGPDKVDVIDSNRAELVLVPGEGESDWVVQLSTPDNRHSNIFRFKAKPRQSKVNNTTAAVTTPLTREEKSPVTGDANPPDGESWLAEQPPGNFTVQLIAGEERDAIERLARQYQGEQRAAVFSMQRNERMLHALVVGSFASRTEAERVAEGMALEGRPWVRSLASVQQVMVNTPKRVVTGPPGDTVIEDSAWVWSQNPVHYTLQLAVSGNARALKAELQRLSLAGSVALIDIGEGDRRSHVLIFESFANKEAASRAIEHLPANVRRQKPWARPFAELHDMMMSGN